MVNKTFLTPRAWHTGADDVAGWIEKGAELFKAYKVRAGDTDSVRASTRFYQMLAQAVAGKLGSIDGANDAIDTAMELSGFRPCGFGITHSVAFILGISYDLAQGIEFADASVCKDDAEREQLRKITVKQLRDGEYGGL